MQYVTVLASDSRGNRTAGSCESASRGELNEGYVGGEPSIQVGAPVRERVVANLFGAAATASKRLAVMAAMASERWL